MKSTNTKYSHRFIARELSLSSRGWFADILAGRIKLAQARRIKLATLFKLNEAEADYFEAIVNYEQAGSEEDRCLYFSRLIMHKSVSFSLVNKDQVEFYSKWFVPVIRELLFEYDFRDNYNALARLVCPAITVKDTKDAIRILLSTGLIRKESNGLYKPCDPVLKKDTAFKSIFWALYMNATIQLAQEALQRYTRKEERDFSAVTLKLSQDGLVKASECLRKARMDLLRISESDRQKGAVYQCNIQLFPVTKPI